MLGQQGLESLDARDSLCILGLLSKLIKLPTAQTIAFIDRQTNRLRLLQTAADKQTDSAQRSRTARSYVTYNIRPLAHNVAHNVMLIQTTSGVTDKQTDKQTDRQTDK